MRSRIVLRTDGTTAYFLGDREVTEAEFRAAHPMKLVLGGGEPLLGQSPSGDCWPLTSEALAVHPKQVREANERNKKNGINVQYDPATGNAVIPDRAERRRLLKLEGLVDKHSFYGN